MKGICLLLMCSLITGFIHAQNVGIGVSAPLGTLDVARGTALNGTAMFRGSTHASHFNYGSNEDTYLRGGKAGSHVIINDDANLGNVGIGLNSPTTKLHIYGSVPELLRLQGPSPYISLYENNSATGYLQAFGNDLFMGTHFGNATGALRFYNNNVNHMTILANGNVGIGTVTPVSKVHIHSNGEALRISGTDNPYVGLYYASDFKGFFALDGSNDIEIGTAFANTNGNLLLSIRGTPKLTIFNDGDADLIGSLTSGGTIYAAFNVTAGTNITLAGQLTNYNSDYTQSWMQRVATSTNLDFFKNGLLIAFIDNEGDWISVSDRNLKENFEPYHSVLEGIKQLHVFTYSYKTDPQQLRCFGLVAQDVLQYFPELISPSDQVLGIAYAKTGVLAIKAIQEQQVMIENLRKEIEELKTHIRKKNL